MGGAGVLGGCGCDVVVQQVWGGRGSAADRAGFVEGRIDNQTFPASEDAFALIYDLEDVRGAYLFIGTTHPELYEQANAEGKEVPYNVHEPIYMVDLDGITYGSKLAALIALEIMHK